MAPRRTSNLGANPETNQVTTRRNIQRTHHGLMQEIHQRINQLINQGTFQRRNEDLEWWRTSREIIQPPNSVSQEANQGSTPRTNNVLNLETVQEQDQGWYIPSRRRHRKKRNIKRGKITKKPQKSKTQITRVLVKTQCPICFKAFGKEPAVATACGHVFCKDCLETWLKDHRRCPVCKLLCRKRENHTVYLEDMGDDESVTLPLDDSPTT
ncbi:ring finger domain-containing protein [Phthorimaea operculella]|nr:ring finger domain-containing protein [Phthorimaea operculella]